MTTKDTEVAKLWCHGLDEPPGTIHCALSSGLIGSGELFKQAPNVENFRQVSTSCCISKEFCHQDGIIPWPQLEQC